MSKADLFAARWMERTLQWFSDNWPDAPWPIDVPRPTPAPVIAQAAHPDLCGAPQ